MPPTSSTTSLSKKKTDGKKTSKVKKTGSSTTTADTIKKNISNSKSKQNAAQSAVSKPFSLEAFVKLLWWWTQAQIIEPGFHKTATSDFPHQAGSYLNMWISDPDELIHQLTQLAFTETGPPAEGELAMYSFSIATLFSFLQLHKIQLDFSKTALVNYLISNSQFVHLEDFGTNGGGLSSVSTNTGKNSQMLPAGAILLEYNKSPSTISSCYVKCPLSDYNALEFIHEKQISLPKPTTVQNLVYRPDVLVNYVQDEEPVDAREGFATFPISKSQTSLVYLYNRGLNMYVCDVNTGLYVQANPNFEKFFFEAIHNPLVDQIEGNFWLEVLFEKTQMSLLDCVAESGLLDYRSRMKSAAEMFPSFKQVEQCEAGLVCQPPYIHKPLNLNNDYVNLSISFFFEQQPSLLVAVGMIGQDLVLAAAVSSEETGATNLQPCMKVSVSTSFSPALTTVETYPMPKDAIVKNMWVQDTQYDLTTNNLENEKIEFFTHGVLVDYREKDRKLLGISRSIRPITLLKTIKLKTNPRTNRSGVSSNQKQIASLLEEVSKLVKTDHNKQTEEFVKQLWEKSFPQPKQHQMDLSGAIEELQFELSPEDLGF